MDPCPVRQRGILRQIQSGFAKASETDKRAAVQCHTLPGNGCSWGDSRSKQMSILCYSKKAWANCLQGLAVSAVH